MKDVQVKLVALVLAAIGIGLCYYKVTWLGFPLQPDDGTQIWTVEARVQFEAKGGPAKVRFHSPQDSDRRALRSPNNRVQAERCHQHFKCRKSRWR